jgi:hypothetical protein
MLSTLDRIDLTTLVNIAAKELCKSRSKAVNERAKVLRDTGIFSR